MANGLINLQTDLKSLRYGNDKPYITKNIGQAPGSQIGMEVQHRIDDTSRIAQMLFDKPGIKYLLHEAELQQVNIANKIKNRGNKTIAGAVLGQLGNTLIGTAKILGSTLAQVPVNGTGLHFLKGFRTDTYLQPTNGNQASGFAQFFGAGGVEGAPLALQGKPIEGVVESNFPSGDKTQINSKFTYYSESSSYSQAKTPSGSVNPRYRTYNIPGSVDHQTVTSSLGDNSNDGKQLYTVVKTYTGKDSGYNIGAVLSGSNNIPTGGTLPKQNGEDLPADTYSYTKKYYEEQQKRQIDPNKPSRPVVREIRVGLGDQSKTNKTNIPYWTPATELEWDKLNMLDVSANRVDGAAAARDYAKLNFELITPDSSTFLYFRSLIDSIDDGYTADWQSHKYVGRAENFYTYAGFDRDISISFKIAAATRNEMKPLYRKMVYLASATAPTYGGSSSKFMRGTVAKITVGSYFDQIPGVITSVKYSLIDGTPWEIAMGQPEGVETDVQVLPMVMQCSVSFKPIHDFAPQTGFYNYFTNSHEGVRFFEQGELPVNQA